MTTSISIVEFLKQYKYPVGNEVAFQEMLDTVLRDGGFNVIREFNLGFGHGRIDFYLPEQKIGIELKVKGSPSEVIRQMHRYAQSELVDSLVLVTGRARLDFGSKELNGKPLLIACLWESLF